MTLKSIVFGKDGITTDLSPYEFDLVNFQKEYCYNYHRQKLFNSLLECKSEFATSGVRTEEFWIGGSFVDIGRQSPNDIDVMLMLRLLNKPDSLESFKKETQRLETLPKIKAVNTSREVDFTCLWLQKHPLINARHVAHWTNLYSFNRESPETRRAILIVKPVALRATPRHVSGYGQND